MGCREHPNKAMVVRDGKLVCPECGRVSSAQPVPNIEDLLAKLEEYKRKENQIIEAQLNKIKIDF